MSALDFEHVPGRLCADPTSLASGSFPWGGTALGTVRDCRLRFRRVDHEIRAEEFGATAEVLRAQETAYFLAVIRKLDTRMLLRLFPGSARGATSDRAVVDTDHASDDERPGRLLDPFALYFSPDSDQHLGVLFYRALPLVGEAEASMLAGSDVGFPVAFVATPDETHGKAYAVGCREDLTL